MPGGHGVAFLGSAGEGAIGWNSSPEMVPEPEKRGRKENVRKLADMQ